MGESGPRVKQVVGGGKRQFVNDPHVARTIIKTVTTISAPIVRDGKIVGVIMQRRPGWIAKMVSEIKIGKTGYGFMLQGDVNDRPPGCQIGHEAKPAQR